MKTINYKVNGKNYPMSLSIGVYKGHNLAIRLITNISGYSEVWGNLTVNLDIIGPKNTAFIDSNNNPAEIFDWIINNGLGKLTGNCAESGYCKYSEVEFFEEVLKEFDKDGYDEYSDIYEVCIQK